MNKRGDVTFTLLFFVALFFVTGSLYSMASFKGGFNTASLEISRMIGELDFAHNYVIKSAKTIGEETIKECANCGEEELKIKFMEIAKKHDFADKGIEIESIGNFFGEIRNGKFSFVRNSWGEGYFLEVEGLFVKSERGANKLKRSFDLEIVFDNEGRVVFKK